MKLIIKLKLLRKPLTYLKFRVNIINRNIFIENFKEENIMILGCLITTLVLVFVLFILIMVGIDITLALSFKIFAPVILIFTGIYFLLKSRK